MQRALVVTSLIAITFSSDMSIAEERNPTEWLYGGVPDTSRKHNLLLGSGRPLLNFVVADFSRAHFDSIAYFDEAQFDSVANFRGAHFGREADFSRAHFGRGANFSLARVRRRIKIGEKHFLIGGNAPGGAHFESVAYFRGAHFDSVADFGEAHFDSVADFGGAHFDGVAYFSRAHFERKAVFFHSFFRGVVGLDYTEFKEGVDFRQAKFDSANAIYLGDMKYPEGEFHFYWDQFKAKDGLRITIGPIQNNNIEYYIQTEILYHQLRDNFLKQGDQSSADAVMYELGWQREEILQEFSCRIYGWIFGYGYQPWRFILFIIFPIIIIFAFIWYWFYYEIVAHIVDQDLNEDTGTSARMTIPSKIIKVPLLSLKLQICDHSKLEYPASKGTTSAIISTRISKYWHTLLFSSSVLLGIRFRKEWIKRSPTDAVGIKSFMPMVTAEWLLGIGLYILFAILAKGHRLEYIKGLLGF